MPGVFELALPRSAVENSSELTRSLQLNDEVITAIIHNRDSFTCNIVSIEVRWCLLSSSHCY